LNSPFSLTKNDKIEITFEAKRNVSPLEAEYVRSGAERIAPRSGMCSLGQGEGLGRGLMQNVPPLPAGLGF